MTIPPKTTPALTEVAESAKGTDATVLITEPMPAVTNPHNIKSDWSGFIARPAIAHIINALTAAKDGCILVWEHEQEYKTGRMFFGFLKDAFVAILLPLLALVGMAVNKGYRAVRSDGFKDGAKAKGKAIKVWAAPKFDYEQTARATPAD